MKKTNKFQESQENESEPKAFLDSIVDNIPHMIFVKRASDLRFVRFNKAGETLLGLSGKDLIGKNDFDLFPEDQARFFTEKDRQVLEGKTVVDIPEESINTPDGVRTLHTKKIPIFDSKGIPRFLLGISEDITDKKKLQENLLRSQKLEAIEILAGGVAHEFNNILTTILLSANFIKMTLKAEDPNVQCIEDIFLASERAAMLTRQLLFFSRKEVVKPELVDINRLLDDTAKLLKTLIREDVELVIRCSPLAGKVSIDPRTLEQILLDLAMNAREAMPGGGKLLIETSCVTVGADNAASFVGERPGDYVCLSVSDTGVGMDETTKSHLFEPFFTTKGRALASGMGLASIYGTVKQSEGFINVESELKKGTHFNIYLPITDASREEDKANEQNKISTAVHTILVVEDEGALRKVVCRILSKEGYNVLDAADPIDALAQVRKFKGTIHLLLTDVVMPHMSGIDLAEQVLKENPTIKVLLMSGYSNLDKNQMKKFGASLPFIQKPLTALALSRKVREILSIP